MDIWQGLALAVAGSGSTIDAVLGLFNGALCNDCDLAAEDVEVLASERASATVTATVTSHTAQPSPAEWTRPGRSARIPPQELQGVVKGNSDRLHMCIASLAFARTPAARLATTTRTCDCTHVIAHVRLHMCGCTRVIAHMYLGKSASLVSPRAHLSPFQPIPAHLSPSKPALATTT
eukprot:356604-Chlamydomonas_euryale.AAC.2